MSILRTRFPFSPKKEQDYELTHDELAIAIIIISSLVVNLLITFFSSYFILARRSITLSITEIIITIAFAFLFLLLSITLPSFILHIPLAEFHELLQSYEFELQVSANTPIDHYSDQIDEDNSIHETITNSWLNHQIEFTALFLLCMKGIAIGLISWLLSTPFSIILSFMILPVFILNLHMTVFSALPISLALINYLALTYILILLHKNYSHKNEQPSSAKQGVLRLKRMDVNLAWDDYIICPACGTINNVTATNCILCHEPLQS